MYIHPPTIYIKISVYVRGKINEKMKIAYKIR